MNRRGISFLSSHGFVSFAIGLISFVVYTFTMCRTISFIDSGELASVAGALGIAHPTGYPLFSILTHLFLLIPFPSEEILRLNIFSAVVVAVGVGVFYHVLIAIQRYVYAFRRRGAQRGRADETDPRFAAAVSALVFGFSTTVWSQSVAIEVYGLHIVLLLLTLYAFFEGVRQQTGENAQISSSMIMAAFLLGLSFTNHMTTILILPALVFLYVKTYGISRATLAQTVRLLPFFGLGISPYLYLPVRGASHPPMDWGYPAEFERLIWHVSGKQYRSWMFSSFDSAEKQLTYFFNHFSSEFNWLIIAVVLYGAWRCFKWSREVLLFLMIAFVSCLFYSINYDIHDIDSYFLLAYMVTGVFAFFGISGMHDLIRRTFRNAIFPLAALSLLVLPAVQVYQNHSEIDESDNSLVTDYTENILSNVEKNAVILSYQWDYFVSPFQYIQLVRQERLDVVVVDKELLRRSWYFIQLKYRYPWLMERCRRSVGAFLAELYKFEHNLPYNPSQIEGRYVEMINDLIDRSIEDHPVYVGPEMEPEFGAGYRRVPDGLLFRLVKKTDSVEIGAIHINYHPASIETRLTRGLRGLYARMLTATSAEFLAKKRISEADSCIQKVFLIDPSNIPAQAIRKEIAESAEGSRHQQR